MADISNSSTTSSSTGSQTSSTPSTSKANGNFSGGTSSFNIGDYGNGSTPTSETGAAHASGVEGPGLANGSFGSSWSNNGNSGSGKGDYTYNGQSYKDNKPTTTSTTTPSSTPKLTVDDVFSTGSGVKGVSANPYNNGDYEASKNESSRVDTSTFGKQSSIVTSPTLTMQDKGLVDNTAIESVEGLVTNQKDKASQEVLEASKKRSEAEEKDKSNQIRDQLKASLTDEDTFDFHIGEEVGAKEKAALDEAESNLSDTQKKVTDTEQNISTLQKSLDDAELYRRTALKAEMSATKTINDAEKILEEQLKCTTADTKAMQKKGVTYNEADGTFAYSGRNSDISDTINLINRQVKAQADNARLVDEYEESVTKLTLELEKANNNLAAYQEELKQSQAAYDKAKKTYDDYFTSAKNTPVETVTEDEATEDEGLVTGEDVTPTITEDLADNTDYQAAKAKLDAHIQDLEDSGADEATVQATKDLVTAIDENYRAIQNALDANDMAAFAAAWGEYNENLRKALEVDNVLQRFAQTDFNKSFTADVLHAIDFDVTLPDGSTQKFSKYATDMATKSPEIASAIYAKKAETLETDGHLVLAKIERMKSDFVKTWFGSKVTLADNQVRDMFNQMAKTNMRATYATYNNVLNNPDASPEAKAEAKAAIDEANALMTASVALQASTGFFSGMGDSLQDGTYGTTDPEELKTHQQILNSIKNFGQVVLGLGVTPSANKAYQNFYYMNQSYREENSESAKAGLFTTDFDEDGFALCQEYGNNAAAGMITGAGELATGVVLMFSPTMAGLGVDLITDSVETFLNGLYGVRKNAEKAQQYTEQVLSYLQEAKDAAAKAGGEAEQTIDQAIKQIEDFTLKADEVNNLDNWLEGSGSNTATNEKFNQSLSYDEWLKLIESDETMRNYAKGLVDKENDKKNNANSGVDTRD